MEERVSTEHPARPIQAKDHEASAFIAKTSPLASNTIEVGHRHGITTEHCGERTQPASKQASQSIYTLKILSQ